MFPWNRRIVCGARNNERYSMKSRGCLEKGRVNATYDPVELTSTVGVRPNANSVEWLRARTRGAHVRQLFLSLWENRLTEKVANVSLNEEQLHRVDERFRMTRNIRKMGNDTSNQVSSHVHRATL